MIHSAQASEDDVQPSSGASKEATAVYQNAGKAFALIEQHRTPPDPQAYALWYAYAAGEDAQVVERVDQLLANKTTLSPYDIDSIYQELLLPDTGQAATQSIGGAIEKEIESVLEIIQQSVSTNVTYQASLNDVETRLPDASSGGGLASLVSRLVSDNRRMIDTTKELSQGLSDSQKQLASLHQELEEVRNQCMRDPLTAIANRRAFDDRLEEEISHAFASGGKLCLAMADIDLFKQVNDNFGHQTGDSVLKMFAQCIKGNIKGHDMVARIGGEEFGIILPQTDVVSAYNLLVAIKSELKASEVPVEGDPTRIASVTASFGVARLEAGMTMRGLIEQADKYLYEAKKAGRDKVKAQGL
ncbi:MAG: GGDEF domain-containing protein [Hyphomonas oceanitis]